MTELELRRQLAPEDLDLHWSIGALQMLTNLERLANAPNQRYAITRRGERDTIPTLTRRLVLRRDNHRCKLCGLEYSLQLDHIRPWSNGGSDRSDNLRTLCEWCNNDRSNYLEAYEPRAVGVVAVCDSCVMNHDGNMGALHERSGLWVACPRCWSGDFEPADFRVSAYCGTCDFTSWVSDERRLL